MIKFLFKGVLRDRSRSLFPFLTVTIGVLLTVFMYNYMKGWESDITVISAAFQTGHVKVTTRAYAREAAQAPNDAALSGAGELIAGLEAEYAEFEWAPRILFGGLLDVPDEAGETRSQGPAAGLAARLLGDGPVAVRERERLRLAKGLVRGWLPAQPGDILLSDELARRLGVGPGETVTLIGATAEGAMATANFTVAGTVRFGLSALDRSGFIADIEDVRAALDMEDAAGEVLGFFRSGVFRRERAEALARAFSAGGEEDDFGPTMLALTEQNEFGSYFDLIDSAQAIIMLIFLVPMALVLWNAGLLGSLRRYGEMGVRLAVGEDKGHVYRSLIGESLIVGALGTAAGTILGLAVSFYMQKYGLDISSLIKGSSMMFPTVIHAKVMPFSLVIGFIPGLLAPFIGTAIAGRGIYKRQTARLFKELET
jgi:putative ABC transport system permease protein